jgi:hypothetical protein
MTRKLMQQIADELSCYNPVSDDYKGQYVHKGWAERIEAALAQPEQGPVAWMYTSKWRGNERFITHFQTDLSTYKADEVWPLFTSPPQRKWVGLTGKETDECEERLGHVVSSQVFDVIEDKLKEKNL